MRAIGFRASATGISYAIVEHDGDGFSVVNADKVLVPRALHRPNQLHFLRTVMLDIMQEYQVERAGLRIAEMAPSHNNKTEFRTNVEGVLQELLASSHVTKYFAGRKDRMASLLKLTDRKEITEIIDGNRSPAFVADWTTHSSDHREAILAGCAALSMSLDDPLTSDLVGVGDHTS